MGDEPSNQLNGIAKVRKMRTTGKEGNPIEGRVRKLTRSLPLSFEAGHAVGLQHLNAHAVQDLVGGQPSYERGEGDTAVHHGHVDVGRTFREPQHRKAVFR